MKRLHVSDIDHCSVSAVRLKPVIVDGHNQRLVCRRLAVSWCLGHQVVGFSGHPEGIVEAGRDVASLHVVVPNFESFFSKINRLFGANLHCGLGTKRNGAQ